MTKEDWNTVEAGEFVHGPYSGRVYYVLSVKKSKKVNELTLQDEHGEVFVTQEFTAYKKGRGGN